MFHSEITTFLSNVGVKTLKNATLSIDVSRCVDAYPRLAQSYVAVKPDHAAIAKTTLLAYLDVGASLLDIKAPKKKHVDDETGVFRGDVVHAIISIGVSAILEEFPDALAASESYALQTEAFFKHLSGRRAKKADRINIAKANVAAFLAMFPSPTLDDVQTFLDAGNYAKPKAPRKRAKAPEVALEEPKAAETSSAETEASDSEASKPSVNEKVKVSKKAAKKTSGSDASDSDTSKVKKASKKTVSKKDSEVFEEEE
jgi:hypothetical protein